MFFNIHGQTKQIIINRGHATTHALVQYTHSDVKNTALTSAADEDLPPVLCVQIQQRPAGQQASIQPKSTCKADAGRTDLYPSHFQESVRQPSCMPLTLQQQLGKFM